MPTPKSFIADTPKSFTEDANAPAAPEAPLATSTDPSGRTPTGAPAPGDTRNGFQRVLDNLTTSDPRREEWQGKGRTGVDSFARGVAENVLPIVSHPVEAAKGLAKAIGAAVTGPQQFGQDVIRPMIESGVRDYTQNGPAKAIPHIAGQVVGGVAAGELGGEGVKALAPRLGDAAYEVSRVARKATNGDPDAAALRAMNIPAKSPAAERMMESYRGIRSYLKGARNLKEVKEMIPLAKQEAWSEYKKAIDTLGGMEVDDPMGPGKTNLGALEDQRLQLSAINRGLKTGKPEALRLAQQKGLSQQDALLAEKRVRNAIEEVLETHGVKPKEIRKTFAQLSTLQRRFEGRLTLGEPTRPYGLGKLKGVSIAKPATWLDKPLEGAKDIVQGRPWWSGKPTDVDVKTAFRRAGDRPDLGSFEIEDMGEGEFADPSTAEPPTAEPSPAPSSLQRNPPSTPQPYWQQRGPGPRVEGSVVQPSENGLGAPQKVQQISGVDPKRLGPGAPDPYSQTPPVNPETARTQVEPTNLEQAKARANQLGRQVQGRGFAVDAQGNAHPVPAGELPGKAPKVKARKGPAPRMKAAVGQKVTLNGMTGTVTGFDSAGQPIVKLELGGNATDRWAQQ